MATISAVTPSDIMDKTKMKYLLDSCNRNGIDLDIIGIGKRFSWLERMKWFKEYLETSKSDIICFTDGYDVFYLDNLNTIKDKFLSFECDIVWSAEKAYTHQLEEDKSFFDNLHTKHFGYIYLNGGTYIGYRIALLKLFTDIIDGSLNDPVFLSELNIRFYNDTMRGLDQTWISHHLSKFWNNYKIKLDIECKIFYLPCIDWHSIDEFIDTNMKVLATGQTPSIIHVCCKSEFEHILEQLYSWKYKDTFYDFLVDKRYTWANDTIRFLKDGKMEAFGKGVYSYIDAHTVKAIFGWHSIHIMTFNNDYSEYTSVRLKDGDTVRGSVI